MCADLNFFLACPKRMVVGLLPAGNHMKTNSDELIRISIMTDCNFNLQSQSCMKVLYIKVISECVCSLSM